MEDFYPTMNVTVFGDTDMKEEMVLTWGLSGGPSFDMIGVLGRRAGGHMNRYQRRTGIEQRPWGDTASRWPSASQGDPTYQHWYLALPASRTAEKQSFVV